MKFTNVDVENMFEENRIQDVLDIFREYLWKGNEDLLSSIGTGGIHDDENLESGKRLQQELYVTGITSPLDVGGRIPVDPRDKQG